MDKARAQRIFLEQKFGNRIVCRDCRSTRIGIAWGCKGEPCDGRAKMLDALNEFERHWVNVKRREDSYDENL